jgi:hypothetical protein
VDGGFVDTEVPVTSAMLTDMMIRPALDLISVVFFASDVMILLPWLSSELRYFFRI